MTVDVSDTHRREIIEQLEFRVCPLIDQQKEFYLIFSLLLFNGQFVLSRFVITLRFPSKELFRWNIHLRGFFRLIVGLFSARKYFARRQERISKARENGNFRLLRIHLWRLGIVDRRATRRIRHFWVGQKTFCYSTNEAFCPVSFPKIVCLLKREI